MSYLEVGTTGSVRVRRLVLQWCNGLTQTINTRNLRMLSCAVVKQFDTGHSKIASDLFCDGETVRHKPLGSWCGIFARSGEAV